MIDNRSVRGFVEKLNKLLFTVRRNSGVPVKGDKLYKRFVIFKDGSLSLPPDLQVRIKLGWGYECFNLIQK